MVVFGNGGITLGQRKGVNPPNNLAPAKDIGRDFSSLRGANLFGGAKLFLDQKFLLALSAPAVIFMGKCTKNP